MSLTNWQNFAITTVLTRASLSKEGILIHGLLTTTRTTTQEFFHTLAISRSRFLNVDWERIIQKSHLPWVVRENPVLHLGCGEIIFQTLLSGGADIDENCLFQEERIRTHYVDQLDPVSIQQFWNWVGVGDFNFILDDGLHTFEAGSNLFLNSIDYLSKTGIYVIEDVSTRDLLRYKEFFETTKFLVDYVSLFRPNSRLMDNNLVVIRKSF